MIRSYQGVGGVSWMINAFSSNLNTLNLNWKITPWPFYKILKGFILKFNSWEISNVVMFCFPYVNTLTWADILFKKLRPETEGWIWKIPFALARYLCCHFILLYGGVDPSAILSELPTYFSPFWCKKWVLWYELRNIYSY